MTKSQSNQAFSTASGQNAGYNANANSTYQAATGDIGDYKSELAKYAAENPYVQGGQYQTSQNQALADTAAAQAQSAGQALQAEQVRSGQNPAAAIAATEQMNQNNTRGMMQAQAQANQQRIGQEAGYNHGVLNATAEPEQMEERLLGTETGAAQGALGDETNASKTPSFWQELGQGVINAGSSFAGRDGKKMCWIAARLWGGWGDRRTVLVRLWLLYSFGKRWYGAPLVWLYSQTGAWIAGGLMPRSKLVARAMERIFGKALGEAEAWLATREGKMYWDRYEWLLNNRLRYEKHPPERWHAWAAERAGDSRLEVL
ncbi:MAG TPA: hypothetical protein VFP94_09300 [Terriglobales bacterium]|nr:hypothetical protein [Terriglobales bacterium]